MIVTTLQLAPSTMNYRTFTIEYLLMHYLQQLTRTRERLTTALFAVTWFEVFTPGGSILRTCATVSSLNIGAVKSVISKSCISIEEPDTARGQSDTVLVAYNIAVPRPCLVHRQPLGPARTMHFLCTSVYRAHSWAQVALSLSCGSQSLTLTLNATHLLCTGV
jgi:hypothetical protein